MTRRHWMGRIALTVLVTAALTAAGQESPQGPSEAPPIRLLVVDATKTFASTVRVGALAGAIRATGAFELAVCFTDADGLYDDPMTAVSKRPAGTYEAVVILPRGLDDGTADVVWIATDVLPGTAPERWGVIVLLSDLIERVFAGSATAVDPTEDLWPALLASLYRVQGWLL